jgi:hypothetical protein
MKGNLQPYDSWKSLLRLALKAAVLFLLFNAIFALTFPIENLGKASLDNTVIPGRLRLPYGENPADSYNLSLNNVPAMFASHIISRPKAADEFRILLIGDSGIWGWLLENNETLSHQINQAGYSTSAGQTITAYNLGFPLLALSKDLLIMDEAMKYEPDLIVWLVTLESFPREKQMTPPLVLNNPDRIQALVDQ